MTRKQILFLGFGLTFLLWALNYVALALYLYWSLAWYDFMMHFLGGLTLGVLAVWFWNIKERSGQALLLLFLTVMALGGVWEVFEYVNGLTSSTELYSIDVVNDLIMDGLGAVAAYYWITSQRQLSS